MRGFLPSWWKSGFAIATLLVAIILFGRYATRRTGIYTPDLSTDTGLNERARPEGRHHEITAGSRTLKFTQNADEGVGGIAEESIEAPSPEERRKNLAKRRNLITQLHNQTPHELINRLEAVLRDPAIRSDLGEERMVLATALVQVLRTATGDSENTAYAKLKALLSDETLSAAAKGNIAQILGTVQTPESLRVLLQAYSRTTESLLRENLRVQIGRTGDLRWNARFHDELSPPLEAAWVSVGTDAKLVQPLADALAKVGAPTGVELLIREVVRTGEPPQNLYHLKEPRALAAFASLERVSNPNAIPLLSNRLFNPVSPDLPRYISGLSLASMGSVGATRILLQWAVTAPDEELVWARQWFGKLSDAASFDLVQTALTQPNPTPFASQSVKDALLVALRKRHE